MPKATTETPADNGSFDELLDTPPTLVEKEKLSALAVEEDIADTPEQIRIRELEAAVARLIEAAAATPAAPEVKTEADKSAEHRKAVEANRRVLSTRDSYETVDDDEDAIVFHFVNSGLTFAGRVWWIGQTVKVKRGGKAYEATVDRNGNSWLDDISVGAQFSRFGKQWVAAGPWNGPDFNDDVSRQDAARGDAAPYTTI